MFCWSTGSFSPDHVLALLQVFTAITAPNSNFALNTILLFSICFSEATEHVLTVGRTPRKVTGNLGKDTGNFCIKLANILGPALSRNVTRIF